MLENLVCFFAPGSALVYNSFKLQNLEACYIEPGDPMSPSTSWYSDYYLS